MHSEELMGWLRKKDLMGIAKTQVPNLKNLITDSLNVKKEGLLIIGDYGQGRNLCAPILAAAYRMAGNSLGLNTCLIMQEVKTRSLDADNTVKNMLQRLKKGNTIILTLSNRLGRLGEMGRLREFVKTRGHKYLMTTGLIGLETERIYSLGESININYRKVSKLAERIKKELDWAREVRIVTLSGTNLKIDITGHNAMVNAGFVKGKGEGGNIPAGEVYIAPTKNGVEGEVVIDGSSRHKHGTTIIERPIKMTIKQGMITKIEGGEEARKLKDSLDWIKNKVKQPSNSTMIGELGIGINPRARIIGSTIVDEKAYGTAHLGIGGNYWFGGHVFSSLHLDQVFRNPIIVVDGKELKMPLKSELE
jgi:hypothetical protein